MIDTVAGSFISPPLCGSLETHIVVRSPVGLPRKSRVSNLKPALPSGSDIAAALFSRPASKGSATVDPFAIPLTVKRHVVSSRTTLVLTGPLDASTVHQMRDAAFTEVGLRPKVLCLDLTDAGLPDAVSTDALVTIGNVARIMGVRFCVRVSPEYARILEKTALSRLVPVDTDDDGSVCL